MEHFDYVPDTTATSHTGSIALLLAKYDAYHETLTVDEPWVDLIRATIHEHILECQHDREMTDLILANVYVEGGHLFVLAPTYTGSLTDEGEYEIGYCFIDLAY